MGSCRQMKRDIVIGASGMVGAHLVATLEALGRCPVATYRTTPISCAVQLDIRQSLDLKKLFTEIKPACVYLPAALTNVDYCESHPAETYQTNVLGIKNVIDAANAVDARIVHFSSDYIFDGQNGPYSETDTANPLSEYGRQKLEALFSKNNLIIRTTVIFGWERQGKNFVFRLVKSLREEAVVKVPMDQIGSPTYVNNLAQIVIELSETDLQGVVNITGPDCVSRYEFARAAARIFNLNENLLIPVQTAELHQPAKRPLNAGLKIEKLPGLTKTPLISYQKGLMLMAKNENSLP
jgi:dTDP-4-dehydrorhamnose reductase